MSSLSIKPNVFFDFPCGYRPQVDRRIGRIVGGLGVFMGQSMEQLRKNFFSCKVEWLCQRKKLSELNKEFVEVLLAEEMIHEERVLMRASREGQIEIMQMVLAQGRVNVNFQDDKGETMLMAACRLPYMESHRLPAILQLLLKAGADVSLPNKNGITALERVYNNCYNGIGCSSGSRRALEILQDDYKTKLQDKLHHSPAQFPKEICGLIANFLEVSFKPLLWYLGY